MVANDYDHDRDDITEAERPSKRARTEESGNELQEEVDEYGVEDVVEPVKASDLYLDTVLLTELYLISISKKSAPSPCRILIPTDVWSAENISKVVAENHTHTHIRYTRTTTSSSIWKQLRQVYVLPDGYPVSDPSLEDIAFVLSPIFNKSLINSISSPSYPTKLSYDLTQKAYLPGYVGLNNIKRNDHMNVVIHSLLHVPPLRDYLLLSKFEGKEPELLKRFAGLAKKVWNPRLFKSQVSPHEFLQEVNRASAGKFRLEQQGDPIEFLGWLLNHLHKDMGGTKKRNSSIMFSTFQGDVRVETQQVLVRPDAGDSEKPRFDIDRDIKTSVSPFLFLAIDLPPPPLFQDAVEKNIIPQVSISSVLSKYDGKTTQESAGQLRRYKCQRLPPYIILHFKRFTKNIFVEEKNPTIVTFPLRGLDFRDYIDTSQPQQSTVYNLIANVTHESVAGTTRDKENTVWKVYLRAGAGEHEKWFMIQDLIVEETRKEMIFLGESVLQIWERRDNNDMNVDS
ncbi:u4 tri-snrnp-associated protein 2 [Moniliophthora roreri]|nr:u4 tri-snrnp-associated protein 2 [Moniliophthora roreri]